MSFRNLSNKSLICIEPRVNQISPITKRHASRLESSVITSHPSESSILCAPQGGLLEAWKLERESLNNTIQLYKEQIEMLTQENQKVKNDFARLKASRSEREACLREKWEENSELGKKVRDYENMLPKIIELETLQERVLD
jgi:septal ring factor EnvC (AmiA/AmiB activator)